MIEFFLRRPIFAAVCSTIILLVGIIAIPTLPIAQYPDISPPTVNVSANYTGANPETVESSVTTPLETAINGVQGLRYMSSTSGSGSSSLTLTFNQGYDLNQAANDTQQLVNTVTARLPAEVNQGGVTVNKQSTSFVMAIALTSSNPEWNTLKLSNYADLQIVNSIKRINGVGSAQVFGLQRYAMRIWMDPHKLQSRGLGPSDVVAAIQQQNRDIAAGTIGSAPTNGHQPYSLTIRAVGRLSTPAEFENIVLRATPDGGYIRLGDVARAEIGGDDYSTRLDFNGGTAIGIGILQLPTANALTVSTAVRQTMEHLSQNFPAGVKYTVAFDTTDFVAESIREVVLTLVIAIALVVLVIFLFLQDWRTTLIPAITIPISLIGTFALLKAMGFSINTLTLFGLTLATGLVVDDAIVVLENIERFIQDKGMPPLEGALAAMKEIFSAVVATTLVLLAVFIPVAFVPGTTGELYRQFALTIAASITISLFNAVTLTPALSALLLGRTRKPEGWFFKQINRAIDGTRAGYARLLPRVLAFRYGVLALFVGALFLTYFLFAHLPSAFIPDEDQGYFIVLYQLPQGSSLDQTTAVSHHVEEIIKQQPEVVNIFNVNGYSFVGVSPNQGIMFVLLKPWSERRGPQHTLTAVLGRLMFPLYMIPNAQVFAFNPPAIQGVGSYGGFQFMLEDTGNVGLPTLTGAAYAIMGAAAQDPALNRVFTQFRLDNPQLTMTVDRARANSLGVPLASVYSTLQYDIGSYYVNDFNYLTRSYKVMVQAEAPYRDSVAALSRLYVPGTGGATVPVTNLIDYVETRSAARITHYDLWRSIEVDGSPGAGYGSGQAIEAMQNIAKHVLPKGVTYEWSGIALEELQAGSATAVIFVLAIVFVYLVLAAQYESFTDPLIIVLAVPLAMCGALGFLFIRHLPSDVFAQVGYVMLIGLASKNAILIVEFANQLQEDEGLDPFHAVALAAQTRLRPILMTSLAFILGIFPLVIATGAGAASRHSLGTAVFGGMIVSTFLNLFVVPVLYVLIERGGRAKHGTHGRNGKPGSPAGATEVPATI